MAKAEKKAQPYDDLEGLMEEAAESVDAQINPTAGSTPGGTSTQDALNERMVSALETLTKRGEDDVIKQKPIHMVPVVTPWNPTGTRHRPKFARPTYINGRKIGELKHTAEEIDKLNQLKPGHYWGRKISVWTSDTQEGTTSVHLNFPNKSSDQKTALMHLHKGQGLVGILDAILAEQAQVVPAR